MPAVKKYEDPLIGPFTVTKKKNARKITLRIGRDGIPNVTIPSYTPYVAGTAFFAQSREWVQKHAKPLQRLSIGSNWELYDGTIVRIIESEGRNTTSHKLGELLIKQQSTNAGDQYTRKAITKYLSTDSERAIEPRVAHFASLVGVKPASTRYRGTTSRWGSCSSRQVLTFSSYIAQLPNELIDYIVIHELCHIVEMNHSDRFWREVAKYDPEFKNHRKQLREHKLEPLLKKV